MLGLISKPPNLVPEPPQSLKSLILETLKKGQPPVLYI